MVSFNSNTNTYPAIDLAAFMDGEEGFGRLSDADHQKLIEDHLATSTAADSSYATPSPAAPSELSKSLSLESTPDNEVQAYVTKYVKKEQVDPIMDAFQKLFDGKIKDLTILTNGRGTSKIFKFECESEHILRVTDCTRPAFFIDTDSEIINMKLVNDRDVAPKLHLADPKSGIIIMDCIRNIPLTPAMLDDKTQSETIYRALATSLKNLHTGPDFPSKPVNIFRDIEVLSKEAEPSRMPAEAHRMLSVVASVEKVLERHATSAPCHRDLHSNNVMFDGKKIYLIDWELGCNSDPISDLGWASMFFVFDPANDEIFLKNYFGKTPTPEQKAYFFLMKQVCICCYACRLMRRVTGLGKMDLSKEQVDFDKLQNYRDFILENYNGCSKSFNNQDIKTFIYYFLREALKNIESGDFQKSIDVLKQ